MPSDNASPKDTSTDTVSVTATIAALAETVFAILADPGTHPAIDGTGWVREALDGERLTSPGQDPDGDGNLQFGGRIWRYDLVPAEEGQTEATLSYDWSAVT